MDVFVVYSNSDGVEFFGVYFEREEADKKVANLIVEEIKDWDEESNDPDLNAYLAAKDWDAAHGYWNVQYTPEFYIRKAEIRNSEEAPDVSDLK